MIYIKHYDHSESCSVVSWSWLPTGCPARNVFALIYHAKYENEKYFKPIWLANYFFVFTQAGLYHWMHYRPR